MIVGLRLAFVAVAALAITATAACSGAKNSWTNTQAIYDPKALPSGPVGESIAYGHDLLADTQKLMPKNVTARMNCSACHINAGLVPRGAYLVGTAAHFPQWNVRAKRVITLHDRLAECFLYSMNGRPPNAASKEMVAMVAYIAWISRGTPVFSTPDPGKRFVEPLPSSSPDIANGAKIYAGKCASCHQADGAGIGTTFPPLWGAQSFNNGAGMAHLDRMTGFVRYNMPQGEAGSLSLQDSYDVAAYVLSHARPKFNRNALVEPSPLPASYY